MAICTKCGKEIPDDSIFCPNCGSEQTVVSKETPRMLKIAYIAAFLGLIIVVTLVAIIMNSGKKDNVQPMVQNNTETEYKEQPDTSQTILPNTVVPETKEEIVSNTLEQTQITEVTTEEETEVTTESTIEKTTAEAATEEKTVALEPQQIATNIVKSIMESDTYYEDPYFPAQGLFMDINHDGPEELLILYPSQNSNDIPVVEYKLWTISNGEAKLLREDTLYTQVGGNSGTIGPVQCGDDYYLGVEIREPEGDRFNTTTYFIPFNNDSSLGDAWVYLEAHGIFDEESTGDYILGDSRVDYSTYQSRYDEFRFIYELNLLQDPGNGHAMPIHQLLRFLDY